MEKEAREREKKKTWGRTKRKETVRKEGKRKNGKQKCKKED